MSCAEAHLNSQTQADPIKIDNKRLELAYVNNIESLWISNILSIGIDASLKPFEPVGGDLRSWAAIFWFDLILDKKYGLDIFLKINEMKASIKWH